jgi:hypothetical protein
LRSFTPYCTTACSAPARRRLATSATAGTKRIAHHRHSHHRNHGPRPADAEGSLRTEDDTNLTPGLSAVENGLPSTDLPQGQKVSGPINRHLSPAAPQSGSHPLNTHRYQLNYCESHCSTPIFGTRPHVEATAKRHHSPGTPLSS